MGEQEKLKGITEELEQTFAEMSGYLFQPEPILAKMSRRYFHIRLTYTSPNLNRLSKCLATKSAVALPKANIFITAPKVLPLKNQQSHFCFHVIASIAVKVC